MSFPHFALPLRLALALVAPLSLTVLGCDEAKLTGAADASSCGPIVEFGCDSGPPGREGCNGELGSNAVLGVSVVLDGSFGEGCAVQVNDPMPDLDGNCSQLGTCSCYADAGAYNWVCTE